MNGDEVEAMMTKKKRKKTKSKTSMEKREGGTRI